MKFNPIGSENIDNYRLNSSRSKKNGGFDVSPLDSPRSILKTKSDRNSKHSRSVSGDGSAKHIQIDEIDESSRAKF